MDQMHGTSLLSTSLPLWTSIITLGKIEDEKTLLLKKIWLQIVSSFDALGKRSINIFLALPLNFNAESEIAIMITMVFCYHNCSNVL